MIPEKTENEKGLYRKYDIAKADGTPLDPDAEFFILRLDDKSSNKAHIDACRKAVLMYADAIAGTKVELAKDLYRRYNKSVVTRQMINPEPHF